MPEPTEGFGSNGYPLEHPSNAAAVPDPSFRDKLAEALRRAYYWSSRWMPERDGAEGLAASLLPLIAAEVQAQVQAATNQRAAKTDHRHCSRLFDRRAHSCGCLTVFCVDHWTSVLLVTCEGHAALAQPKHKGEAP